MKKVSFIKGWVYDGEELVFLPDEIQTMYFRSVDGYYKDRQCTESFTAEITVKIVPYEQQ